MSAYVRCFALGSLSTAHVNPASGQFASDSVGLIGWPYLAKEAITANTGTAQSTSAALTTSRGIKLLRVEVEPGKTVGIEFLPPNRTVVAADTTSPRFTGDQLFACGQDWILSIIEIA
jgi:hypothetical protein